MADPEKLKRLVTESLILAFASTRARALVGTDALRSVIDFRYREMTRGGIFDLTPLAELLEEQPGYEADPVSAALLRFKSWEARLGIEVRLPPGLADLAEADRAGLLEQCSVPPAELARVFRGGDVGGEGGGRADDAVRGGRSPTPVPRRPAARASLTPPEGEPAPAVGGKPARKAAPSTLVLLGLLGALGVAFAVWYGVTRLATPAARLEAVPTQFAGEVPLASAQRSGPQVVATLRDDGWLRLPAEQRAAAVDQALHRLPADIKVLVIRDTSGRARGSAQWAEPGHRVVVRWF